MTTLQEQIETGKLQITFARDGHLVVFEHWDCDKCDGRGILDTEEDCDECGGTGECAERVGEDDPRWPELVKIAESIKMETEDEEE